MINVVFKTQFLRRQIWTIFKNYYYLFNYQKNTQSQAVLDLRSSVIIVAQ